MLKNPALKTLWNIAVAVAVAVPTLIDGSGLHGVGEWCIFIAAIANAALVWAVPEMKDGVAKYAKSIVAIVVAATAVVPALAIDGWQGSDSIQILILSLGALVTPVVPNAGYVYARKIAGPR